MSIVVAGAPVSFGVFELTPTSGDLVLPTADEVVAVLERTGYSGVDLGPVGFLGRGQELRERLDRHGLELAGGWIDLPFSDDAAFARALPSLDDALDVFSEVLEAAPSKLPLPTLADSGDAIRKANPRGGAGHGLDEAGWDRFAKNLATAAARVRARGLEPTFHHHACTFVETPHEIDAYLDASDVGLTFDTGHMLIGGGDPLEAWRRWRDRINHLHIKDVHTAVLADVLAEGGGMIDVWSSGSFVPLGEGDLDVEAMMSEVVDSGFDGWLVIEQDVYPQPGDDPARLERDHRVNREALRRWL
ncbi:sugar phosphate isomerase/epimerase family protein [Microterricola viridarii]|uniref:2-keto-myo-inositol dehydratase n=1 Tax=Microterricola viridarii TaxID=412690 RepID=A0A1H1NJC2_9MICO|nr:sugar phosphate isomerase/epimerase [Microterricola viridarii]SDR99094.1 2-keto-myo-inositol dehydratase [Microterricola viridarii]